MKGILAAATTLQNCKALTGLSRRLYPAQLSHLLASLVAFLDEHRYCGELGGAVDEEWIWMTCTCGAVISRTLEPARRQ